MIFLFHIFIFASLLLRLMVILFTFTRVFFQIINQKLVFFLYVKAGEWAFCWLKRRRGQLKRVKVISHHTDVLDEKWKQGSYLRQKYSENKSREQYVQLCHPVPTCVKSTRHFKSFKQLVDVAHCYEREQIMYCVSNTQTERGTGVSSIFWYALDVFSNAQSYEASERWQLLP